MYIRNAMRLTFSEIGLAPSTMAPMAYQTATCAETLICCEECPMPHQTSLYISGSTPLMMPTDHRKVGMRMIAPQASVADNGGPDGFNAAEMGDHGPSVSFQQEASS